MTSEQYGIKLRVHEEKEALSILDGQSKICNWLYNYLLEKASNYKKEFRKGNKEVGKTLYTKRGLRNLLPEIKKEHPFLKVVHSSPLKNTALRCSEAIRAYQDSKSGKRKGKAMGWPKFRSCKRDWFSLFYDEPTKGFRLEGDRLILSLGMGEDRKQRSLELILSDVHLLEGKTIRNLRIVSELGVYYAVFTVQREKRPVKAVKKVIALDPNHKNFAYGVGTDGQGIEIASPHWLKTYDKRIDELKSRRDRCNKKAKKIELPSKKTIALPSKEWQKRNKTLQRALHKRREQTKTFMFTTAHLLFKEYDCVAIGDYAPDGTGDYKRMRRAMNNRSLIGRFKKVASWVGQKTGKMYLEFDERRTTKTCHKCQVAVEGGLPPKIRQWRCAHCQAFHIRDENAAINGLGKVLRDLATKCESNLSHIVSGSDLVVKQRWAWCVQPRGVISTLRGLDSKEICSSRKLKRERSSSRPSL